MNVIGDVGMILGSFVLFVTYHSATFAGVFQGVQGRIYCTRLACPPLGDTPTLELAAFLLLVGAIAQAAQLPPHTWLPDSVDCHTPVSARIHPATMFTASVD